MKWAEIVNIMKRFLQTLCRGLCGIGCVFWQEVRNTYTIENAKSLVCFLWGVAKDIPPAYKAFYLKFFDKNEGKQSPIKKGAPLAAGSNIHKRMLSQAIFFAIITGMLLGATLLILLVVVVPIWLIKWIALFLAAIIPVLIYQMTQFRLGYDGELAVGEEIAQIARNKQWGFFHSFNLGEGKSDIDHIVVCPKGVFCIETKTLRKLRQGAKQLSLKNGMVLEGKKPLHRNPVGQVKGNAKDLRDFICKEIKLDEGEKVPFVIPVLVFPGWFVNEQHDEENIFICNPERLGVIIDKSGDDKLSDSLINKICMILKKHNRGATQEES